MTISHRRDVGLVSVASLWLVLGMLANAAGQQEQPVAVMNGEPLYERDYLPQVQTELYKIRRQEYELKLKTLEAEINHRLALAEAEKHGLTEEEWLRREVDAKVPEPTNEEVERVLAARMFGARGRTNKEAIAEELKEEWRKWAREDYFLHLREQAGVKIFLAPPRIEIAYDPARVRGNPDAPVTLVEFSDFHCPFCGQAYPTLKNLLAKYSGRLKLVYRDLPLEEIPPYIVDSPEAARCAGEQGMFWEYHDLLFENQERFGEAVFKEFAEQLKLDAEAFGTCLQSGKFKAAIEADYHDAVRLGATGTPFFFINGMPLGGVRSQQEFEDIIEAELKRSAEAASR
jgi:predicted DsbA family dithiol-disulfide isomerase